MRRKNNLQRKNKYNAAKVIVDGMEFASKAEAKRYKQLVKLVDTGVIKDLCRQVTYVLHVSI